ncbi:hypothetical protein [Cryobacterium sp. PH31-L1]|uniref:DUF7937 domain-containing protein n=1 Tax=Cryobacterium sp. PH31-L1 TaxID=3046199 RepID=UPI0024B95199|nr:hypothetical protein [Cryobacterium sp. PH31-L1]MDJ0376013.1 hypothetical protein [Cryobacterium sp. PH31-L1]
MTFDPNAPQQPLAVPQYAAPQQYAAPDAPPQYAPAPIRPNPFAGIPASDWARDGGALLLLLISLALPWMFSTDTYNMSETIGATGRIEVILITLLSLFSLSLTYLLRAGVFGPGVGLAQIWLIRLLVNVPYTLLVLGFILGDAFSKDQTTGLGYAAAFGLAGAFLAAQPRAAELVGIVGYHPIARLWHRIVIGYGAVVALTALGALVLGLVAATSAEVNAVVLLTAVLAVLTAAAAVLLPIYGIIRGSAIWLTVGRTLGGIAVAVITIDAFTDYSLSVGGIESLSWGGYPLLLLAGLLGLASAPALRLAMVPIEPIAKWFGVASLTLVLIISAAGLSLLLVIANLIGSGTDTGSTGLNIGATIVLSIIIVVAIIARTTLRSNPAGSQWLVLGLTSVITVLGIVFVVLRAQTLSDENVGELYSWMFDGAAYSSFSLIILTTAATLSLALAFGLPALVFYSLTAPAAVRGYFNQYGPVRAQAQATYTGYAPVRPVAPVSAVPPVPPTPQADAAAPVAQAPAAAATATPAAFVAPVAPAAPATAAPVGPPVPPIVPPAPPAPVGAAVAAPVDVPVAAPSAASLAAGDPATSAAELYDLAQKHPEVWPQLAGNPSTYLDLLTWLAQSPEPLVQQALRARGL